MRELTLDEKISFKGIFEKYGLSRFIGLPKLTMQEAVWFYGKCCGNNIMRWHLFTKPVRHRNI